MRWLVPALLAGILLASRPTHADEPSLTETLLWMDNTYNPHEHYLGHGRWETYSVGKLFQRRFARFTYDGCKLTFSTTGGVLAEQCRDNSSLSVNLADLDPTSIHTKAYSSQTAGIACEAFPSLGMDCDVAEMTFETRNQVPLMETRHHFVYPELKGKDHDSYAEGKSFEAGILIDDVKYASLLAVPLTTIHQPCAEMGAAAVATMIQRLRSPGLPARDILLNFRLVVRESSGASGTDDLAGHLSD